MKILALLVVMAFVTADVSPREALQPYNEFIGEWKGVGTPERPRPDPRDGWRETISWAWKFSGNDAWLVFHIKDGKYLKSGSVRLKKDEAKHELTVVDVKDQKLTFRGSRDAKGYYTFERVDPASGETQQLILNTAADGVRFVYRYAVKPAGRTVFTRVYQVAASKEGESLAAKSSGKKGPECIVTGGLGTIAVVYKGKTYYVCCTGCKEAFESDPEKYIKEAEKK